MSSWHIPPEIYEPGGEAVIYGIYTAGAAVGTLIAAGEFCYDGFVGDTAAQNSWGVAMAAGVVLTKGGLELLRRFPATRNWFNQGFMPPGLE
jgi:hypothetical protein